MSSQKATISTNRSLVRGFSALIWARRALTVGAIAAVALSPQCCFGGFITGVTASGNSVGWLDCFPDATVNGSGMTPSDPVTIDSVMGNDPSGYHMWLNYGAPDSIKFVFDANQTVGEIVIWNYNQGPLYGPDLWLRGLRDVEITYSTGSDEPGLGNTWGSYVLNKANGNDAQPYTDDITLPSMANVKAVLITYSSNWNGGADPYYGLSEVRFGAPVPEPSTFALLACGLAGLLAWAWRTRK